MLKIWTGNLIYLMVFSLFFSCTNSSDQLIPKEKLILVLTDIHIADGIFNAQHKDINISNKYDEVYQIIYEKHGIDKEQLDATIDYYSYKPDELNKIYDEIIDRLNELQVEVNKEEAELKLKKDSISKIKREKAEGNKRREKHD